VGRTGPRAGAHPRALALVPGARALDAIHAWPRLHRPHLRRPHRQRTRHLDFQLVRFIFTLIFCSIDKISNQGKDASNDVQHVCGEFGHRRFRHDAEDADFHLQLFQPRLRAGPILLPDLRGRRLDERHPAVDHQPLHCLRPIQVYEKKNTLS